MGYNFIMMHVQSLSYRFSCAYRSPVTASSSVCGMNLQIWYKSCWKWFDVYSQDGRIEVTWVYGLYKSYLWYGFWLSTLFRWWWLYIRGLTSIDSASNIHGYSTPTDFVTMQRHWTRLLILQLTLERCNDSEHDYWFTWWTFWINTVIQYLSYRFSPVQRFSAAASSLWM